MATAKTSGDSTDGGTGSGKSHVLCSVEDLLSRQYDFVVVGGGTSGLCVAARLTENPNITVAVIEAGEDRRNDPAISIPAMMTSMVENPQYDWCLKSIPQPDAGNKPYSMPRGKVLGGSSGINFLMYVRGSKGDYNGWESLGNDSWGWNGLAPYFKKHQTIDRTEPISINPRFQPAPVGNEHHGTRGPIHTSFVDWVSPFEEDFVEAAYDTTGRPETLRDPWSGDHIGFYSSMSAINRSDDKGHRSYSATGYLKPNLGRPNLKVLTQAHATKILGIDTGAATTVEFIHQDKTYTVEATKEVILSTGAIHTPQLLELSGIGDPDILSAAGVPCLLENEGIGANFQDHVLAGLVYDLKPGIPSFNDVNDPAVSQAWMERYIKTQGGPASSPPVTMGFLSYASLVSPEELEATIQLIERTSHTTTPFAKSQEKVILDQLRDPTFANLQTLCTMVRLDLSRGDNQTEMKKPAPDGRPQVLFQICLQHPLSRGSVHITTPDPQNPPAIDPGYFRHPADPLILAAGLTFLSRVVTHPVLAPQLGPRSIPPPTTDLSTVEGRVAYLREHITTQYHPIGTAAMGVVVDDRLKVKGVKGLRVVDASVFPGHVSGNIGGTVYAVAEKGADLVKEDWGISEGRTVV